MKFGTPRGPHPLYPLYHCGPAHPPSPVVPPVDTEAAEPTKAVIVGISKERRKQLETEDRKHLETEDAPGLKAGEALLNGKARTGVFDIARDPVNC
ncbi:MAG: hypothetical protein FJ098_02510 [Deltaproteobacteria bacterium]|nr:hypothetical protein [Deltaproteobacteria bacterium]